MDLLDGSTGIVTGGGSGIGRAIAMVAAREGANVVVADINASNAEETASLIGSSDGRVISIHADVSKEDAVKDMLDQTISSFGKLDWAVNNAASQKPGPLLVDCTDKDWDFTIKVTLKSVWLCMKYEIPQMINNGGGSIVNIGSMAGVNGNPMQSPYAAAKGGVIALSKTAAAEYAPHGIRVNVINPGMIRTPGVEYFIAIAPDIAERCHQRPRLEPRG